MKRFILSIVAVSLAVGVVPATTAQAIDQRPSRRGEQNDARQQFMAGEVKSLREIESRVVPRMRGMQYLGPEYDARSQVYRLKFLDNGRVVFVDVDARTGSIIRQIG